MNLNVIIEQRFYKTPDGKIWTENSFSYPFWLTYLEVYESVNVVARIKNVESANEHWLRVNGENVSCLSLPYYIGPIQFILMFPSLWKAIKTRNSETNAVIYRVPSILSCIYHMANKPSVFGAEVVGDPAEVFTNGLKKNRLRHFYKSIFCRLLAWQCANADSIAYVTKNTLQRKYPPKNNIVSTNYSSIRMLNEDYKTRAHYKFGKCIRLLCIGSLEQPYKGCDFMLSTLKYLHNKGNNIQLTWIGGGRLVAEMQALALKLGIEEHIEFTGNLVGKHLIQSYIDKADIFILSSRTEGLPRVLIEAMARATLAIGTRVGGVPELLPEEFIVERDDVVQLAEKIESFIDLDEEERKMIGHNNYLTALDYAEANLHKKRISMYQALKESVESVRAKPF